MISLSMLAWDLSIIIEYCPQNHAGNIVWSAKLPHEYLPVGDMSNWCVQWLPKMDIEIFVTYSDIISEYFHY